jgi:hypothetical protein
MVEVIGQSHAPASLSRKKSPDNHGIEGWVGLTAYMDVMKKENVCPLDGFKRRLVQPWLCHRTHSFTSTSIQAAKNKIIFQFLQTYSGADKSLAQPGRKQATASEDFGVHKSYLLL